MNLKLHGLDCGGIRPRNQIFVSGNKIRRQPVWTANKSKKTSHQFKTLSKLNQIESRKFATYSRKLTTLARITRTTALIGVVS